MPRCQLTFTCRREYWQRLCRKPCAGLPYRVRTYGIAKPEVCWRTSRRANLQNISCARRKYCRNIFGQEFDSPHLHHSGDSDIVRCLLLFATVTAIHHSLKKLSKPRSIPFGQHLILPILGEILGFRRFPYGIRGAEKPSHNCKIFFLRSIFHFPPLPI